MPAPWLVGLARQPRAATTDLINTSMLLLLLSLAPPLTQNRRSTGAVMRGQKDNPTGPAVKPRTFEKAAEQHQKRPSYCNELCADSQGNWRHANKPGINLSQPACVFLWEALLSSSWTSGALCSMEILTHHSPLSNHFFFFFFFLP